MRKQDYIILSLLLLFSLVPVVAGGVKLAGVLFGEATADNQRFFISPWPFALHILSASFYCMAGAFQFAPNLRRRHMDWHKRIGVALLAAGLISAGTGLWMNQFYQLPAHDGPALYVIRMLVGSLMIAALLAGIASLLRGDFKRHGEMMIRAYALGMGAGTQVLTHLPWVLFWGKPDMDTRAVLMGLGWGINVVVAEWIILRLRSSGRRGRLDARMSSATVVRQ